MSILERLSYNNGRVLEVTLYKDKKTVNFMEACDLYFDEDLNKDELGQLIEELKEIHDKMVDAEDKEQNELDCQFVVDLRNALAKAIQEADMWYDDLTGRGYTPNLEKERMLLKSVRLEDL